MGTPDFAVPILEALINSDFLEVISAVCNQDSPVGRKQILTPPPIKILAQKYNIPVLQPDKIRKSEWIEKIKELNPELIVVAAFGQIIPKEILDIPKYKAINVHGSLLPKLRGASPIQYAILEGHQKTGITIMIVDELMDHGPILAQKSIQIEPTETSKTLYPKMAKLGTELLMETLSLWITGKIEPQEQKHDEMTLTKILKKEDGKINWADPAEKIERQIRAFNPWPGAFCFFQDPKNGDQKRLKILEADDNSCDDLSLRVRHLTDETISIGLLFVKNNNVLVQTGRDCLRLIEVQPEGKNPMSAQEFLNGCKYLNGKNIN